jgi:hypothetical protein
LWWLGKEVVVNVWDDGTVEVTGAGIRALDIDNTSWISERVGGEIDAFVMVEGD